MHVDQSHVYASARVHRPQGGIMDVVHPRCCGLDVHKQTVVAYALT